MGQESNEPPVHPGRIYALAATLLLALGASSRGASTPGEEAPEPSFPPIPVAEAPHAEAAVMGEGELLELVVAPSVADLRGSDSSLSLVVTGVYSGGGVRDLTAEASFSSSDAALAAVSAEGLVRPLADGRARVRAAVGSREAWSEVAISHAAADLPVSFPSDVVPIFSKHGCNAGGCHGKSGGQNGFQLSLFGFVPRIDHSSLTRESRGRRVFPAAPEHSLLLRKATGTLPHGGGERFRVGSPDYRLLHRWMRTGMPFGSPDDPTVTAIEVFPRHRLLERGGRQQLRVTARYSDGRVEDVTPRAEFSTGEEDYLQVSSSGRVTVLDRPGQGTVLVRYLGKVGLFRATIPYRTGPDRGVKLARPEPRGFIDRHVFARLDLLGIPSSPLASDAEFLRRAGIDICGITPTAEEAREFLRDPDPRKREKLVDRLLERPEHASYFSLFWADLLRNQRGGDQKSAPQTIGFHRWIYEGLVSGRPLDQFVRELLCAEGSVADNPAVAWYRQLERPQEVVDDVAQVFLGTRLQCARCHHHPYEKWGQEDYWSLANFFSRVGRKNEPATRAFTISLRRGSSRLTDDEPTSASYRKSYDSLKLPGGPVLEDSPDEDPRQRLADWIVSPENPLFARGVANRYWKHFLGRGIVEPEDDLRETNPPSNPELLDALARDFIEGGYDLRRLIRAICGSATYQMSAVPEGDNALDRQSFSRFQPRRLSAEVLLDAIDRAAGARTRFSGVPREARAIELPDEGSRNYFLEVFGKPDRTSACSCERSGDVTLTQVIHLLNSREVQDKLSSGEGRAAALARDARPDEEKARELFLWVFAREATGAEVAAAVKHLADRTDASRSESSRRKAWEDLLWALINSKEFLFQR